MCGIAGTIGTKHIVSGATARELITRMCDVIAHRGPDDWGYHLDEDAGMVAAIGMRRLSIIDVSGGHQPISNEDGSVWIVFNGEIYNHHELRKELISRGHKFTTRSDTETIVHLYEEEGERCVEWLRGMFGIAIWDRRDRSLLLARDRVGKKPMHYTQIGDTLVFGSEIKSLLQHPQVKREVNLEALSDFLSFGYIPDPATAFRGIDKLPPGHTLVFKDGELRTRCYWDFNYSADSASAGNFNQAECVEQLRELLAESVRIRLESEVPLGAFLSGGIDSSTIVALMAREMRQPVKTFSIGFKESNFDELKYARVTAKLLHTDHHEFIVTPDVCRLVHEITWHHDEPFGDVSNIPTYVVSKMASEKVTVVLSGDGGDELFGGYERYVVDNRLARFNSIPRVIRNGLLKPFSRALPQGFYGKRLLNCISLEPGARYVDILSYFNEQEKNVLLSPGTHTALKAYKSARRFEDLFNIPTSHLNLDRQMYLDCKTYLPGDILAKVDRMSMAHSIETRAPLLDHKLIEFVQTIPSRWKLRGNQTKYILKSAVAGLIPDEIINRPKQGFDVPIREWFNEELGEMLNDTLNSQSFRERGYFNHQSIGSLIHEHRRGVRDHARHLWSLLTLELWHRLFIDRTPDASFSGAKSLNIDELNVA